MADYVARTNILYFFDLKVSLISRFKFDILNIVSTEFNVCMR